MFAAEIPTPHRLAVTPVFILLCILVHIWMVSQNGENRGKPKKARRSPR